MNRTAQEGAPTSPLLFEEGYAVPRFLAVAGLAAVVVLVAVAMFGGGGGYRVTAVFENAGQLVRGNQVTVGGRAVGDITEIELDDSAQARVTLEVKDSDLEPLHEGTTATIRATSLSGIANRYISLKPGPNDAPEIPDGGEIDADRTTAPVDIDQLFNTLDPKTRRSLRRVIRGSGEWYAGRSDEASESVRYLAPALSTTSQLTREVALDQEVFERFVTDTATVVSALAERRDDLAGLVTNANTAAQAIGDEEAALDQALAGLPETLRKGNTTFVNLRSALEDLDVLVAEAKPATRELTPFLRRLQPLVADARPTIRDLRRLIRLRGPANDLTEIVRRLPRVAELAEVVVPRTITALSTSIPIVAYARQYTPDLAGWVTKFGQGAATYDANGHYVRIQPVFGAFRFTDTPTGGVLTALPESGDRLTGFATGRRQRCPGAATQPPPDGSAPVPVEDCNPAARPPGP